jgi:hypothetical protein
MSKEDMGTSIKEWFEWGILGISVVAGVIIGWLRISKPVGEWLGWGKGKEKSKKSQTTDDRNIQENLNKLRYDSDACRVKVIQYHNGGSFANGKSMKKMSLTHESCHPGMVPTYKNSSDQILSLFVDMVELAHNNTPELINTSSVRDSHFKSYLQSNHVLMFSVLPIRNLKGEEIGCMLCEWCAWSFADSVQADRFWEKFSEARNSIEYFLNVDQKKKG